MDEEVGGVMDEKEPAVIIMVTRMMAAAARVATRTATRTMRRIVKHTVRRGAATGQRIWGQTLMAEWKSR